LTGCRRGEIENLSRQEIDIAGRALRLGDTKTGRSIRPIGGSAINLLREIMSRSEKANVFPAARKAIGPFQGLPRALRRLVAKDLPGLTAHGLRHSFASTAEDLGYTTPTIGALLGHAGTGVTHGYIHKLDQALIAAADRISEHIATAMAGSARSNVVALPSRPKRRSNEARSKNRRG
jgi:integrase